MDLKIFISTLLTIYLLNLMIIKCIIWYSNGTHDCSLLGYLSTKSDRKLFTILIIIDDDDLSMIILSSIMN